VTIKLWEPKRKRAKAVPRHLQNHVVWSRTLMCSVKSYVTGPSTKCYFNECLFRQVFTYDKNRLNQRLWAFGVPWSPSFVVGLPHHWGAVNEPCVIASMVHLGRWSSKAHSGALVVIGGGGWRLMLAPKVVGGGGVFAGLLKYEQGAMSVERWALRNIKKICDFFLL
jgi:hypothetical protein